MTHEQIRQLIATMDIAWQARGGVALTKSGMDLIAQTLMSANYTHEQFSVAYRTLCTATFPQNRFSRGVDVVDFLPELIVMPRAEFHSKIARTKREAYEEGRRSMLLGEKQEHDEKFDTKLIEENLELRVRIDELQQAQQRMLKELQAKERTIERLKLQEHTHDE